MDIDNWLIDLQLNGDDGTGHCDYVDVVCDFCGQSYEMEQENESYV